jgi:hypothetical protein
LFESPRRGWKEVSVIFEVELGALNGLGTMLQELAQADELRDLQTDGLGESGPPAVDAARSVSHVINELCLPGVKERLGETGEICVNLAGEYQSQDEQSIISFDTVMKQYTNATGDWDVPEVPTPSAAKAMVAE